MNSEGRQLFFLHLLLKSRSGLKLFQSKVLEPPSSVLKKATQASHKVLVGPPGWLPLRSVPFELFELIKLLPTTQVSLLEWH